MDQSPPVTPSTEQPTQPIQPVPKPQQKPPPPPSTQQSQTKYKIVGGILGILGVFNLFYFLVFVLVVLPQLLTLYSGLNVEVNFLPTYIGLGVILIFTLCNTILAFLLVKKSTQRKELFLKIGLIILVLYFISIGVIIAQIVISQVNPLYNVTSELRNETKSSISPSPNTNHPTADWKTYTNDYFSIKYPDDWKENPGAFSGDNIAGVNLRKVVPGNNYESNSIIISVTTLSTDELQQQIDELLKVEKTQSISIDTIKGTKLEGLQKVNSAINDWKRSVIYLEKNGKKYLFIMTTSKDSFDELDQILSTFKFTNQTQAPTSSPATYVCPSTNIDCMPIVEDFRKWQCESTYLEWVGKNCPGIVVVW